MNGAKILAGALVLSILAACSAAGPDNEATEGSSQAVTAAVQTTPQWRGHHPACTDTNPSCTSKLRAANTNDPIEAKLAQRCFFLPFDWRESNSDSTMFIEETFFFCPDTPELHAYVDPIGWDIVHTTSEACGVCIPSAPHGFTYVVTNRRENAPNCGTTCAGPALSRW
jgi:hypothetical protein